MVLPNGTDPIVIRRNFLLQQQATDAVAADLAAHIADTDDAHDASAISYDNSTSGMSGANVQAVLDAFFALLVIDEDDSLPIADENGTLLLDEVAFA